MSDHLTQARRSQAGSSFGAFTLNSYPRFRRHCSRVSSLLVHVHPYGFGSTRLRSSLLRAITEAFVAVQVSEMINNQVCLHVLFTFPLILAYIECA